MARSTLNSIIAEVRRKVFDFLPDTFGASVHMVGDAIRLGFQFRDMASVAATLAGTAVVKVYSPQEITMLSNGVMTVSSATGFRYYDYQSSNAMSQGIWRAEFIGSVGSVRRHGFQQFEIMKSQYIWTPDEIQTVLDRHRIFTGETREKLSRSVDYKRYWSESQNYEWANLFNTGDSVGTGVTPDTANLVAGEWTFTTAQDGELYVEGHYFNIYGAAAELLEELAADPNRAESWTRGAVSQQGTSALDLATYYRRIAHGGRVVQQVRIYR